MRSTTSDFPSQTTTAVVKVVGSLNWDIINRVQYHDGFSRHRVFSDDVDEQCAGGHGANQAVSVYRSSHSQPHNGGSIPQADQHDFPFEVEVHMVGMVGEKDGDKTGKLIAENLSSIGVNVDEVKSAPTNTGYAHVDKKGKLIVEKLSSIGINVDGVKSAPKKKTGYAYVAIDKIGKSSISTKLQANNSLSWSLVEEQLFKTPVSDLILVSLETPEETVRSTIKYAKTHDIEIIFNPAPYYETATMDLSDDKEIFKVDHLILNSDCAYDICHAHQRQVNRGLDKLPTAKDIHSRYMPMCDYFHNLGAQCVVITLGNRGAIASQLQRKDKMGRQGQKTFLVPAQRKDEHIDDETGASDAFIGAYAVEILQQIIEARENGTKRSDHTSLDITSALEMGIKSGGLTTQSIGSLESIPWRHQLLDDKGWFTPCEWFFEATI